MKQFKRSKKLLRKQIFIDGLDGEVIRDCIVVCNTSHVISYWTYKGMDTWKQELVIFPKSIPYNINNSRYIVDIYLKLSPHGIKTWIAYKGTIRTLNGNVVG